MIRFACLWIASALGAGAAVAQPLDERLRPRSPTVGDRISTVPRELKRIPPQQRVAIARATAQSALAELPLRPNNEALWSQARTAIGGRLDRMWRQGSLEGRRAEEAWFVRCDATTMDAAARRLGRLVCLVGVAPRRPGEFEMFQVSREMGPRRGG